MDAEPAPIGPPPTVAPPPPPPRPASHPPAPVQWRTLHPVTVVRELLGLAWNLVVALVIFGEWDLSNLSTELGLGAIAVAVAVGRFLSTRFAVTDAAFLYRRGLLVRRRVELPRTRVQNVEGGADVFGRLFGLRTVTVSSAGSEGEVKLAWLAAPEAGALIGELLAHAAEGEAVHGPPGAPYPAPYPAPHPSAHAEPYPAVHPDHGAPAATAHSGRTLYVATPADIVRYAATGPLPWLVPLGALSVAAAVLSGRGFLAALAVGWPLVGTVIAVVDLLGFRLTVVDERLVVRHGVVARKEKWARRQRVQLLGVERPLVRGALGYETVNLATADATVSARDPLRVAAPLLRRGAWAGLAHDLLEPVALDEGDLRPISRLAVRRRTLRWTAVAVLIGTAVTAVAAASPLDGGRATVMGVTAGAALVPLLWTLARRSYRIDGYATGDGHVLVRRGVFGTQLWLVRLAKVQTVTVRATFFQRRLGLASVAVDTAAPRNGAAVIDDLPEPEARHLADALCAAAARVHLPDGV
ncbi:MAG: PH domain-containing protein [Acidimicrobiia bacterium]